MEYGNHLQYVHDTQPAKIVNIYIAHYRDKYRPMHAHSLNLIIF